MRFANLHLCLLSTFLLAGYMANGQHYLHKQWDKRFGGSKDDSFINMVQTNDGGFILSGISDSPADGDKSQQNWDSTLQTGDAWIIKIDANGNKLWDKRYGGTKSENANNILATRDNGYAFTGLSHSPISGNKSESCRGQDDYWLVKIDPNGNKIWDKRFGGTNEDGVNALALTADSGFLMGGDSNSSANGDKTEPNRDPTSATTDYWIVRTDKDGNKLWDKTFGGNEDDALTAIYLQPDGGALLAGFARSGISGDKTSPSKGDADIWLVRIDSIGNKLWDRSYGGAHTEFLWSLIPLNDGFILGSASYSSIGGDKTSLNKGNLDYWIIKINAEADIEWDKDYGGTGEDFLQYMGATADNGLLLAGSSTSNKGGDKSEDNLAGSQAWIVKTDSLGNKEWDKTIFLDSIVTNVSAAPTADGCFVLGVSTKAAIGGYKTEPTRGGFDYWIMKFCVDTFTALEQTLPDAAFQLQVFPNPTSSEFSIYLHQQGLNSALFTITNSLGQTVYQKQENNLHDSYTKMLDVTALPTGSYFVTVTVGDKKVVRQVVKQ